MPGDDPVAVDVDAEAFAELVQSAPTDPDDQRLREVSKTLFVRARDRPEELLGVVDSLAALLAHPDGAVRAWTAGALGRLAAEHPDAVARAAPALRDALGHDDDAVRRVATAALVRLAQQRPDAVP